MTALKEYERLEASGLWRSDPDAQRRDVYVSIGEATLTISDFNNQALTHWSLAAIGRLNPGERPAVFHPDGDPGETLEIPADEGEMIDAIERLRRAVSRARPRMGRLRLLVGFGIGALVAAFLFLWLPGAMQRHVMRVLPEIKRQEIGLALLAEIETLSGPVCDSPAARPLLRLLANRLEVQRLVVVPGGVHHVLALPGGMMAVGKTLIEDYEDPSVLAGFVLVEQLRRERRDPLLILLQDGGVSASFSLLTQGFLDEDLLRRHAADRLVAPAEPIPDASVIDRFRAVSVASTPYAFAKDPTGETTLALIEGDPMSGPVSGTSSESGSGSGRESPPVLRDRDWVRLQGMCDS